ncbi:MAG: hypothetical protein ACXWJC_12545 [Croceibacterium sp.]
MIAKPLAVPFALILTLAGCHDKPQASQTTPEPVVTATPVTVFTPPPPPPPPKRAPTVSVMQQTTPCGAEKLQNYLNLTPTSTAKDEIARTLGHNRVRYIGLKQAKAEAAPGSTRVTAGIGVDGRIKEFACG